MNRRYVAFGAVAGVLVLLNLLRWNPLTSPDERGQERASAGALRPEDFALRVTSLPIESGPMRRDLFHARPVAPRPGVKRAAPPPGPPPKSPEELAAEEARSVLSQIKVVGIVFRDGVGQAYVTWGGQSQLVRVGDVVGERFRVEEIRQDAVELADGATETRGRIPLTGT